MKGNGEGEQGPPASHEQSGSETLQPGGSLSLFSPILGKGSQHSAPPGTKYEDLASRLGLGCGPDSLADPQGFSYIIPHEWFTLPCPALVLPNYKIISSNDATLTSKLYFVV